MTILSKSHDEKENWFNLCTKSRALVLTGDSCPVRSLRICFTVALFPEGDRIGFPGQLRDVCRSSAGLLVSRQLFSKPFQIDGFQKANNFQDEFSARNFMADFQHANLFLSS